MKPQFLIKEIKTTWGPCAEEQVAVLSYQNLPCWSSRTHRAWDYHTWVLRMARGKMAGKDMLLSAQTSLKILHCIFIIRILTNIWKTPPMHGF